MEVLEKLKFTKKEVLSLLVSVLVLGFIFSYRMWYSLSTTEGIIKSLNNFFTSVVIVGFSFLIHELAHKITAQNYECEAEYQLLPKFLLLSLAITFLSGGRILFAVPGYVAISTAYFTRLGHKWVDISPEEEGKIALIGPLSNLLLAFFFRIMSPFMTKDISNLGVSINTWFAFFNSFPIPPLDGSKVLMFSRILYTVLLASTFLSLVFLPVLPPLYTLIIIISFVGFLFIWGNLQGF